MMGQAVVGAIRLFERYDCRVIPIRMTDKLDSLKRFSVAKIGRTLQLWASIAHDIATRRPDAVYLTVSIEGYALFRDYVTITLCQLLGRRRILHLHTKGVGRHYQTSWLYRFLYRSVFKNADILHLSDVFFDDLRETIPRERFWSVANGIDVVPDAGEAIAERSRAARDVPVILFLSNLIRTKGPLDLLVASDRLAREGVAHKVNFIGGTSERDVTEILASAQRDHGERIAVLGPLYGAEKAKALREADIFALPTYYPYEAQPLVVMEAMAYGLAITAAAEGAVPGLLEGGVGLLFPPRDVGRLTSCLRQLIEDRNLRIEMGKVARRRYVERYTLAAFQDRFVDTIDAIMSGRRNSSTGRLKAPMARRPS